MQVELPDVETWAPFEIRFERPMDDDAYFEFCAKNRELRIEREATGEITIMPPVGAESGNRNYDLNGQLYVWATRDGRGEGFDSSTEFFLPGGAAYAPDASWVLKSRLTGFTRGEKKRFLHLCPDFVVELMSPSDRLSKAQAKMVQWIANGVALGWLIDPDRRVVYIYRPGREPECLAGVDHVDGEGPVSGFRLELKKIWQGL